MKRILICLATMMIFATGIAFAAPAGDAIGILDVNLLKTESAKFKALQAQLSQKDQELKKQLDEQKASLSAEEFKKKQEEAFKTFLQTMMNFEMQIETSIRQAAEQVAKEKNLDIVIYKNNVIYGGVDITRDVINKIQ